MPMPTAKHKVGLGRALMNQKAKEAQVARSGYGSSGLHTTEISKGSGSNLRSVTHEGALDEFLNTAQLADADFTAERRNVTVVTAPDGARDRHRHNPYLLTGEEEGEVLKRQDKEKSRLRVPRRPAWNSRTTPAELARAEADAFLEWRRGLALLQEGGEGASRSAGFVLTPFERNIEVWRQLWRVLERSHLVVQIVDARNPLRFRCEDLEKYVEDVGWGTAVEEAAKRDGITLSKRANLLLVNKADLLDDEQRRQWSDYFAKANVRVAFFSALDAAAILEAQAAAEEAAQRALEAVSENEESDEDEDEVEDADDVEVEGEEDLAKEAENLEIGARRAAPLVGSEATDRLQERNEQPGPTPLAVDTDAPRSDDPTRVLNVSELEELFLSSAPAGWQRIALGPSSQQTGESASGAPLTKLNVGLVGYPNVGKSSTINALLGSKKVSVSSTPGKTKHFQTLHLSPQIVLCDCPGLVFPQFATSSAELVVDGVLPIDQMREFTAPSELVARRIPKEVIEGLYGIRIEVKERELGGDGNPTGLEILTSYALARGYTRQGQSGADESRAARYILKDYVNAKLLYCHPPPGQDGDSFNAAQRELARQALRGKRYDPSSASGLAGEWDDDDLLGADGAADGAPLDQRLPGAHKSSSVLKPGAKSRSLDQAFFADSGAGALRPGMRGYRARPGNAIRGRLNPDGTPVVEGAQSEAARGLVADNGKKHYKGKRRKQRSGAGFA